MNAAPQPLDYAASASRPAFGDAERNFAKGVLLTIGLVLLFQVVYWYEREVLHLSHAQRFVPEASEAAMRYFTVPHIIIGFLFSVTSPRNRSGSRRALIAGLVMLGAALCGVYWYFDGYRNPIAAILVYAYFLVHEMRDEAFFYRILGDSPPITDRVRYERFARGLMALFIIGVGVLAWPGIVTGVFHKATALLPTAVQPDVLGGAMQAVIGLAPLLTWGALGYAFLRAEAQAAGATVAGLLRTHAPLLRLYAGVMLVLVVAMSTARRPYALILLHVAVWYVFTCQGLRRRPAAGPPTGVWNWMRTTVNGFRALHLGMAALLMGVGLAWVHLLGKPDWLWYLVSPESFLYWTIMHITVSFVPR